MSREKLPSWDRICDDFVQEETQRGLLQCSGLTSRQDKEDVALTAKGKKKNKKGPKKSGAKQQDGQKKDLSIVKCFACHKMGHYVGQCLNKKKKKQQQTAAAAEVDDFATRFQSEFSLCTGHVEIERASIITSVDVDRQREFSLVTDHSYSASASNTWYIDSGASSHMTGAREMFFELS